MATQMRLELTNPDGFHEHLDYDVATSVARCGYMSVDVPCAADDRAEMIRLTILRVTGRIGATIPNWPTQETGGVNGRA
jgi:hypothetical protein